MFVERMEVLEYRQKFEVELSTFPDSTNTETQRKLFYFHVNRSIGIVQKIDFEIRPDLGCTTLKTSRKVVLDNPSVCLSVCLAVAFPASYLTGVRFNRSSCNFRGMFGYMGHCAALFFEAICEPVCKIIL